MGRERRSDPTKLARDRQRIEADLEERMHVPQEARRYPDLLEKARRFVDQKVSERRNARNPKPDTRGAKVIGFRPPRNDV
jgi:hypothetical protein